MREIHPVFDNNIDSFTRIWRYFDFPKFVSLLTHKGLYFSQARMLGDPLEGSFHMLEKKQDKHSLTGLPKARLRKN